jgi:hypothetical protein
MFSRVTNPWVSFSLLIQLSLSIFFLKCYIFWNRANQALQTKLFFVGSRQKSTSFIHSFVHSFLNSFIHSFIHSFILKFIRLFTWSQSTIYTSIFSLIRYCEQVVDIPLDHPSCSKQHAVIQFRQVPIEDEFGIVTYVIK